MIEAEHKVAVWDWPVRLSHWSFAILVLAMWYTAENGLWYWHTRLGVCLLGVLVFRLIWGFIGSRTARFSQFVKGPSAILAYLRGNGEGKVGHSPLGALSVLALLGAMSVQVGMGLFAGDPFDGATGPLNALVGVATADMLTEWHEVFYWAVLGMAGLHLLAIAFYAGAKHDDLVTPMVTGSREADADVEGNSGGSAVRFAIAFAMAAGIAGWVWLGAPPLG
ncbi:MAG: cytochrome b/b6 domain-containing protein [Erythrobacter sp.]